jgi:hypothetical protein
MGGRAAPPNSLTRTSPGTATMTTATSVQGGTESSFSPNTAPVRSSTGRPTSPRSSEPLTSPHSTTTRPTRTVPPTTSSNRAFSSDDDTMPMPTRKTTRSSSIGASTRAILFVFLLFSFVSYVFQYNHA